MYIFNFSLFIEKVPDKFFFNSWIKRNQINSALENQLVVLLSAETHSVARDILYSGKLLFLSDTECLKLFFFFFLNSKVQLRLKFTISTNFEIQFILFY